MSSHDPQITLRQLEDFITEARALAEGRTLESIMEDAVVLRAFERVMELVGEYAKRLPMTLRERYPDIPWKKIVGMRDVISHAYEDLSYEILWDALNIQFPSLQSTVRTMIVDLES